MKRELVIVSFLLSTTIVFSQEWYSSPVYNGRDVNCVKIFSQDTFLVAGGWQLPGTSTRSIFKTFNSAHVWYVYADTSAGSIRSMEFFDSKNGIGVGDEGTILKTANGGEKWSKILPPVQRDFNKIFFIDAMHLIIVGGVPADSIRVGMQTILKSSDGGLTWSVVHDQPGFWLRSVHFPVPSTGFAVGDSGTILKSTDGGNNWNPVAAPVIRDFNSIWFSHASNGIIAGGKLSGDSIQTILRTTDGGSSWTVVHDTLGGWLTDVHFLNADTGFIVGDRATFLKTADGGQTWSPEVVDGADSTEYFNTVRFYDSNFGVIGGKWGRFYLYALSVPPEALTLGADVTSPTTVALNGYINSHDESAQYDFIYSLDSTFATFHQVIYAWTAKSDSLFAVRQQFEQLQPNSTYYYFLKAWTYGGASYGDTLSFFTGPPYLEFKTMGASSTNSSATLSGFINNFHDGPLNLFFEYGTTEALGNEIPAYPGTVNDTLSHDVTAVLDSLQIYTRYYFRLKGVGASRNYYGNTSAFFTGKPYKEIQTLPATEIRDSTVRLNGFIEGFLFPVISLRFEYGVSPSFGSVVAASPVSVNDTLPHFIAATLADLQPYTDYYYRLIAETSVETFVGSTVVFNSSITYSDFQTLTASNITPSSARLNGYADSLSRPIALSFEYGITPAMGNSVAASPPSISDTASHYVYADINNLQGNTIYYYRLKGSAGGIDVYGDVKQFYCGNSGVPNWDFQQWREDTFQLAEKWNIIGDDYAKVPGTSGSALKLWNNTFTLLGIVADNAGSGNAPTFIGGVPFRARPDSIVADLNYFFEPDDTGMVLIHLYNSNYDEIATNFIWISGTSGGVFKREAFPIAYNSSLMPDSIVLAFMPTHPADLASSSNYIIVDNIKGVPSSPEISNGDFESWFDYRHNTLLDWTYAKHLFVNPTNSSDTPFIVQTVFAAPGDFAAELRNRPLPAGLWMGGELSNNSNAFGKYDGSGFPVSARHHTLNGYYKWLPAGGDTLEIIVDMIHQGRFIGRGTFYQWKTVPQFEELNIPIGYNFNTDTLTPDTALIVIRSYKGFARGPSKVIIDKLNFDGFLLGTDDTAAFDESANDDAQLFPNPASNLFTLQLPAAMQGEFSVFDMSGAVLQSGSFNGSKIEMDVSNLKKGLYLIHISTADGWVAKRFVVMR